MLSLVILAQSFPSKMIMIKHDDIIYMCVCLYVCVICEYEFKSSNVSFIQQTNTSKLKYNLNKPGIDSVFLCLKQYIWCCQNVFQFSNLREKNCHFNKLHSIRFFNILPLFHFITVLQFPCRSFLLTDNPRQVVLNPPFRQRTNINTYRYVASIELN